MSSGHTFQPIAARPAPDKTNGLVAWIRQNLFSDLFTSLLTLVVGGALLYVVPQFLSWAVFRATWLPDFEACKVAEAGACWGVVAEKFRLILLGRYPFEEHWRPVVATVLMMGLLGASCSRAFWKPWLAGLWAMVLAVSFVLMYGNMLGLPKVETDRWGGLPLTILLAALSMTLAFPIAMVVALGRRSSLPAIKTFCTIYVELIRGVPLVSVLFMASFMFPLFMPQGFKIDVLIRVLVGITLFAVAHLAHLLATSLYNSYLPLIAPPDRFARISGLAWGLSYLGSVACYLLSLPFTRGGLAPDNVANFKGAFVVCALFLAFIGLPCILGFPRSAPPRSTSRQLR
mgnify:CR=1 FL=1